MINEHEPKISVITIFYNEERFIKAAIESVLSQTYKDWELLLVDDGSRDLSSTIAIDYSSKYPSKIKYLEHHDHENRGMSASRNLGLNNARGEYILFLDADDVLFIDTLEKQFNLMESIDGLAMACGRYQEWFNWDNDKETVKREDEFPKWDQYLIKSNQIYSPPDLLVKYLEGAKINTAIFSMIMRKSTLIKLGGSVDSFRLDHEDHVLLAKFCLNENIYITNDCLK